MNAYDAAEQAYKRGYEAGRKEALSGLVRCKECKHWKDGVLGSCDDRTKYCEIGFYKVGENGYCVYGERSL